MIKHKILVLLPCLNESSALARTIEKIYAEIPDAVVVVIDNGSTDNPLKILQEYINKGIVSYYLGINEL